MRETFRMQQVQTPVIPVVGELVKAHPGTISLGQGVAYYGPPPEAIEQIERFLADPENHKYKLVDGIPELLQTIRAKLAAENGIRVEEDSRSVLPKNKVVVTAGGNMAAVNAILAITDPGDEVILPAPYYFNHEMAVVMADCRPVVVPTDESYQLRLDAIRRAVTPRTRAVLTVSPNNPSGAVYPEAALREVNALCRDAGLYHINDEAYEYFTYSGARHFSPGSIPGSAGHTISLFSLSKAYGFASWRVGWMVIPEALLVSVKKIQDTILICPPVISQYAAVGAMGVGAGYCHEKRRAIEAARALVLREFAQVRDTCTVPRADGAFYFLLRVHTDRPAMEVVERLVREHGVAVMPGPAFGMADGCYLRVAYGALQPETAAEGIGRLCRGLRAIVG
ncbi:MAG: pyridoxal phosphate-dependent aminotransferase [Armatimonadetes bacterium]|nr:pyridoxal phosphate-dependent aminotransferase [Armatimonadota bacterium]